MTIKTQSWTPDTHPAYTFIQVWMYPDEPEGGWPDPENIPPPEFMGCSRAERNGQELADPDVVHAIVQLENQSKNHALAALSTVLPEGIEPIWTFGDADGKVDILLPAVSEEVRALAVAAIAPFSEVVRLG